MIIEPAERLSDIKEYYFSRKLAEVARLNAEGKDIVSLGIGGPDLPPAESVLKTLSEASRRGDTHGYMPTKGDRRLRESFARFYKRHYGVDLDAESELQPLIGSKEGILHLSLAFINPGDKVLVPNPGYPTYTSAPKLAGAQVIYYDLKEEQGWLPDFAQLERLAQEGVKMMWVNYPHMPTGTPARRDVFEKLVAFGHKYGILIVNDNPYSFILNEHPQSILSVAGAKEVAMEMNSLSKSHNMPGWRIGMIAGNKEFISTVLKVKSNVDSGQYLPMQLAAAVALDADSQWYGSLNKEYALRRATAEKIMRSLGCSFDSNQRGLFLWGKIPEDVEDVERFTDRVLYEAGVFITPGFIFGSNGDRYIRISLCANQEKLNEALRRTNDWRKKNEKTIK
ncbi:MAG: aminotransferase class I/II-fold pyridoxal phosphate-dependent enzyme [Prevotella sp.]|nr:aminotransferase class I/II-fold pyridoxal phosphate-dependent enzyme [Bacteroides sp.]MCM1366212.1 aminotransferase class I/II-fold pyridoxal phosphate-dependent enzyme [Prevotella sp.]